MNYLFSTLFLIATSTCLAQEQDSTANTPFNFAVVEHLPLYQGCDPESGREEAMTCLQYGVLKHVSENFKYPEKARKKGIEGKVYVNFVIEKDGSISNMKVARGAHKTLDKEAIRVIKSLPKFDKPAYQRGKRVRMQYTIPINAKL